MVTEKILKFFGLSAENFNVEEIKVGHINDTFLVCSKSHLSEKKYIFQKINTYVFKEPEKVMFNIEKVSEHLKKKIDNSNGIEDFRQMLFFLKAKDGKNYYLDEENNFWRAYIYVDNAFTYDYPENNDILRLVGDGFGLFQNRLSDFDASILYETIPNFHNTKVRIETFKNSVKKDSCKRVSRAEKEISYILSAEKEASVLSELVDNEAVPLRVTHNDTKCNNLLFDKNLKIPVAVIDLDTIMPGLSAYDFGDAVRVVASTAMEDEPDISKVHIDLERFESFTSGFVSRVSSHLEPKEIDLFALGAFTMTYEVGLRFLTDYLDGDVYFKIGYPEHNLIRARVQLALADDIRKNLEEMKNIVKKYC